MAALYDSRFDQVQRGSIGRGWINAVLGIWLFVSPWVLGFGAKSYPTPNGAEYAGGWALVSGPGDTLAAAAWNAWIVGALVAIVALTVIARLRLWQDHVILVLGAWIFASPWVLGFQRWWFTASWDHWLTGLFVFLIACWFLPAARTRL